MKEMIKSVFAATVEYLDGMTLEYRDLPRAGEDLEFTARLGNEGGDWCTIIREQITEQHLLAAAKTESEALRRCRV